MNHTERMYAVARQVRGLTRNLAREAIERYLASAAEEIAHGETVILPGIGRMHAVIRKNGGRLVAHINGDRSETREPGYRVQLCLRLDDDFKAACHHNLDHSPGSDRVQPGEPDNYPGSTRTQPGKQK